MTSSEIREKYFNFMKKQGHEIIPSASLRPENDPTTLFTGSGMQPLLPYLLGESHPKGVRLADSQKCFRAEDIEEVGDNRHTTFFEMLGNWSLGDYFKEEQLKWFFEFLTKEVGLDPQKLYVTAFAGDTSLNIPKDTQSAEIWKELFSSVGIDATDVVVGSEEDGYSRGMKEGERIFYYDAKKNWWSRAGVPENMPAGEPGGPDSEVFYDFGTEHDPRFGEHCHPNCDCGRFMEIGNSVFMEYLKEDDGSFTPLPQKNVDFGGGLERITAASNKNPDVFKIDIFEKITTKLEDLSGTSKVYNESEEVRKSFRVIADHFRALIFMLGDGVVPSKKDAGYFVRRLIRSARRHAATLAIDENRLIELVDVIIKEYGQVYPNLIKNRDLINDCVEKEITLATKAIQQANQVALPLLKLMVEGQPVPQYLDEDDMKKVFSLHDTHGMAFDEIIETMNGLRIDAGFSSLNPKQEEKILNSLNKLKEEHRKVSRAGAEQKFKGGLADHGEKTVQYHTATHLLLAGLRKELGNHVHQAGSNITGERIRFDFTHPEKVDKEAQARVEEFVNNAIQAGAHVEIETIKKVDAENDPTVEGSFWEKYPEEVKVYTIKDDNGVVYSRELCGGPHVESTSELTGTFRITKEEASSAGVRRIKAVLE